MKQKSFWKLMLPMMWVFFLINCFIFYFDKRLDDAKIDHTILAYGNMLIFFISAIALFLHVQAAKNPNPNVLVRSIMGSTLIKMIVLGTAVVIYVKITKENRNVGAIVASMGFYLAYMAIEVKTALKLNKKQPTNAGN